ncbi:proton-coupled folate transporter-like [Babylonia areolata]|uniref:proton-coupled folate transporter-like n=1 Tax=Babylonia areolata TaxID=304850 RepID=UPI003FD64E05
MLDSWNEGSTHVGFRSSADDREDQAYLLLHSGLQVQIQRQAAGIVVAHRLLVSVPAVFLGLFCGAWSDTRGRKLPMMAPSVGSCLAVVFYILCMQVSHTKVALLLAGAATQGIFGKTQLISMALNSDPQQRTRRLGRLLGSSFLGIFLGSLLAGVLQDTAGLTNTLVVVSVCHFSCTLVVLLGVTDKVGAAESGGGSDVNATTSGYRKLGPHRETTDETGMSLDADRRTETGPKGNGWEITFHPLFPQVGDQDVTVLFIRHPPLSWTPSYFGYLLAVDYAVMGFALLFVLPVLSNVLHVSDTHLVLVAVTFKLCRALWAGFCTQTWMMFTSVGLGSLGGLINPGLRAILTKTADGEEVGKLFSIQASLETLSKLIGSGVFTGIYAATVDVLPAAAYLSEMVVYLGMVGLLLWLGRLLKDDTSHDVLITVHKHYQSVGQASRESGGILRSHSETSPLIGEKEETDTSQ